MSTDIISQSADGCVATTHPCLPLAAATAGRGKPWLSVIMPVYCGERWLDAALASLSAEADRGLEIVMIDSSPSPASREIAGRYLHQLRLRIVQPAEPIMWHAATNLGVELAQGDYICWLHQDDLWLRGRAAAVRSWIQARPDAALHISPTDIVDPAGKRLGAWRPPFRRGRIDPRIGIERLLVQNTIAAPAPVVRKDAWVAAGGLDETLWYTADWDMWLKLAGTGQAYYHDQVTTGFRIHAGSQTVSGSRNVEDFEQQMQTVLDRHLPCLGEAAAAIRPISTASITVNAALAAAAAGDLSRLLPAATQAARLRTRGLHRYLRDSRIVERVMPRLRCKLAGTF